jgi:hypothetical protein
MKMLQDIGLARVFVEQERQRLKELEQELEQRISSLDEQS